MLKTLYQETMDLLMYVTVNYGGHCVDTSEVMKISHTHLINPVNPVHCYDDLIMKSLKGVRR